MGKKIVISIVGILLLSAIQSGHGIIDSLLLLAFFLILNTEGHIFLALTAFVLLGAKGWDDWVRFRQGREQAKRQVLDAVRKRTAAMEARIALLEGRAAAGKEGGGKEGGQAVLAEIGDAAKDVAMASSCARSEPGVLSGDKAPAQTGANGAPVPMDVGRHVNHDEAVVGMKQGLLVLVADLVKMIVFVSYLALLWAGSVHLFSCGEMYSLGSARVSFHKCSMNR